MFLHSSRSRSPWGRWPKQVARVSEAISGVCSARAVPHVASLHTGYELHPERHRPHITALEIAVARQRPQREEFRIAVIAQIEHARETRRGVARFVPETVGALVRGEIGDAA